MKLPDSVRCENCVFLTKKTKDGKWACHRYPPTTIIEMEPAKFVWSWPLVEPHHFCGEFRPKDNLTAVEWVTWLKGMDQDAITPNV